MIAGESEGRSARGERGAVMSMGAGRGLSSLSVTTPHPHLAPWPQTHLVFPSSRTSPEQPLHTYLT